MVTKLTITLPYRMLHIFVYKIYQLEVNRQSFVFVSRSIDWSRVCQLLQWKKSTSKPAAETELYGDFFLTKR